MFVRFVVKLKPFEVEYLATVVHPEAFVAATFVEALASEVGGVRREEDAAFAVFAGDRLRLRHEVAPDVASFPFFGNGDAEPRDAFIEIP